MMTYEKIRFATKYTLDVYRIASQALSSGINCFDWTEVDSAHKPIRGVSIYKCTGKLGNIRYAYESWVGDSEGECCGKQLTFCEKLSLCRIYEAFLTIFDYAR